MNPRAEAEQLGRKVALKLFPQYLTQEETQLSSFQREARTASALNHPNILTVYEIGADAGRHFMATEFIEGETLRSVMARGKMEPRELLELAFQVGSALAAAHKSGVVHRDIKPENIMLRPDGLVKVLDFGIAKLAQQDGAARDGVVMGTPRYMSLEQTRGETVDERTDIWSFGAVLHEMLGSKASPRFERIVRKAMRTDKEERYQNMDAMLVDLRRLKEGKAKFIVPIAAAAALGLAGIIATVVLRSPQNSPDSQAPSAPAIPPRPRAAGEAAPGRNR